MILGFMIWVLGLGSWPRTSGDDPATASYVNPGGALAPHERG